MTSSSNSSAWEIRRFNAKESPGEDVRWLAEEICRLTNLWETHVGTSIGKKYGGNPSPRSLQATMAYLLDAATVIFYVLTPDNPKKLAGMFSLFVKRLPWSFCFSSADEIDGEFHEGEFYFGRFNKGAYFFGPSVNLYYPMVDMPYLDQGLGRALIEHAANYEYDSDVACLTIDLAVGDDEVERVNHLFKSVGFVPSAIEVFQSAEGDEPEHRWVVYVKPTAGFELVLNDAQQATGTRALAA